MVKIAVYDVSRLVTVIEADPKTAWDLAIFTAKRMAYQDRRGLAEPGIPGRWYRTANRVGFAIGCYRATNMIAASATSR